MGTDEEGKRTYSWKHLFWKQVFLFSSQVKASSCQRHQKQQSAEVSERPGAQSVSSLLQLPAAAKGGVRAWGESCEEWNVETIKPSPLNFPALPCSFLCCRPCSDWSSHYIEIFSFASNPEAVTQLWSKPGMHRRSNLYILSEAFQKVHFLQSLQTWH